MDKESKESNELKRYMDIKRRILTFQKENPRKEVPVEMLEEFVAAKEAYERAIGQFNG